MTPVSHRGRLCKAPNTGQSCALAGRTGQGVCAAEAAAHQQNRTEMGGAKQQALGKASGTRCAGARSRVRLSSCNPRELPAWLQALQAGSASEALLVPGFCRLHVWGKWVGEEEPVPHRGSTPLSDSDHPAQPWDEGREGRERRVCRAPVRPSTPWLTRHPLLEWGNCNQFLLKPGCRAGWQAEGLPHLSSMGTDPAPCPLAELECPPQADTL